MRVAIIGAGGHGRVVLDILRAAGGCEVAGFIDANPALTGTTIDGVTVLGAINLLPKLARQQVRGAIVAIGDGPTRRRCASVIHEHGLELVNAIHPRAYLSPTARIGRGVVVAAMAAIGTDSYVEDLAIINTGAVVDHECRVGEAAHICPGAKLAGRVSVGAEAFIGLNASVIQCVSIGPRAIIGAGAVVLHDVPEDVTAVGVPVRVVRSALSADLNVRRT